MLDANKPPNLIRSDVAHKLQGLLHGLASNGVLNPATPSQPFDADRRCRRCGSIHAKHPRLLAGGKCFRDLWGGPPPLQPTGLNRRTR